MNLFEYNTKLNQKDNSPLAYRMRPQSLDEIVGQQHIVARDKLLHRLIIADKVSSILLYGPAGTGKTSLAQVIAHSTKSEFHTINATVAGKKDMEEIVKTAKQTLGMYGKKTILFIDEIHRFNKAQQDYLLPFVEDGTLILIGATTENPYFEVNSALLSRMTVFALNPLTKDDILVLLKRTISDSQRGLASFNIIADDDALNFLAESANGDARRALTAVEIAALSTQRGDDGNIHLTLSVAGDCIQQNVLKYDKDGDNHYDTISAFIKSMRGSDPDAAIYYLARMLAAGESVTFIARRIMICASEDVGNADPEALKIAVAAALAVERVGMPESQIILAHAASYVALAKKSNSSLGIFKANDELKKSGNLPIPAYLRDAHYPGAKNLNNGTGYKYAHAYPEHYVNQQYLPDAIADIKFFNPGELGFEGEAAKRLDFLKTQLYS